MNNRQPSSENGITYEGNGSSEVRSEALYLLGILDDPSTIPWLLNALSDPTPSVRIDALLALCRLSNPPPASSIAQLLDDPDEQVRIQLLKTLADIGDFDPIIIKKALSDSSTEVRDLAQQLLEE
jgi:HEAT repeat protein